MGNGSVTVAWICLGLLAPALTLAGEGPQPVGIPLQLDPARAHQARVEAPSPGEFIVRTDGDDPFVECRPIVQAYDPRSLCVVSFEYFCPKAIDHLQIFFGPPISEKQSASFADLPPSEAWVPYAANLSLASGAWNRPFKQLRLDFGRQPDREIRIRNLQLRAPSPEEQAQLRDRDRKEGTEAAREKELRDYLTRAPAHAVRSVVVEAETVKILGTASGKNLLLGEVGLHQDTCGLDAPLSVMPLPGNGAFTIEQPRFADARTGLRDRLFSRWAVFESREDGAMRLASHAVYPTDVTAVARWPLPEVKPLSKKGMAGIGQKLEDLVDLGVHNVTVNIVLSGLIALKEEPGTMPFGWNGRTYFIRQKMVEHYDQVIGFASAHEMLVSAILLIPRTLSGEMQRIFVHPDAVAPGIYSMANVTTPEGVEYYAALIAFLAERYSQPDRAHGRITHWIVHNEVDAGWVWTNCGKREAASYMDLYHKSLRTVYYAARQYNPNAKVFISLTHYWTARHHGLCYPGREMLELLNAFSKAEGDFEWGVAHHPYPEDLRNPRVWEDRKTPHSFDAPIISFKNLEVLDQWMHRPDFQYRGTKLRTVLLSEQGPNTPDYSETSFRDHAACLAYAWKKLNRLESIEAFDLHRHIDVRGEGGLRLGLWTLKNGTEGTPDRKKPGWSVYQKLGTPDEDAACAPYLNVIGIKDWREIYDDTPCGTPH